MLEHVDVVSWDSPHKSEVLVGHGGALVEDVSTVVTVAGYELGAGVTDGAGILVSEDDISTELASAEPAAIELFDTPVNVGKLDEGAPVDEGWPSLLVDSSFTALLDIITDVLEASSKDNEFTGSIEVDVGSALLEVSLSIALDSVEEMLVVLKIVTEEGLLPPYTAIRTAASAPGLEKLP